MDDCAICLEPLDVRVRWCRWLCPPLIRATPCEHSFHRTCIDPWLAEHAHCPFCRAHIGKTTFPPSAFRGVATTPRHNSHNTADRNDAVRVTAHGTVCIEVRVGKDELRFERKARGVWVSQPHGALSLTQDGVAWDEPLPLALVFADLATARRLHEIVRS